MEQQQEQIYASRERKQSHYDKRLILKIVSEIENGLPRKEAIRIYGLVKGTLDGWMRDYSSLGYRENIKRRIYTNLQKRTIVTAIEQGRLSVTEAKIAYNIKDEKLIRKWILQYKSEKVEICIENTSLMAKDKPSSKDLEKEALQKALKEAELKIKALNTLIDVAEEQLKIDIRKKSGAKQS
jgi:transposase